MVGRFMGSGALPCIHVMAISGSRLVLLLGGFQLYNFRLDTIFVNSFYLLAVGKF